MKVIGLTGGIGSGKTTVLNRFKQLGAHIISMDQIAHELAKPNGAAYADIVQLFGSGILNPDHTIDRKRLGQLVFEDSAKRQQLEALLHPLIRQQVVSEIADTDKAVCVVEIPLLNARDQFDFLDLILVVDAPPEAQIERIQARDSLNKSQIDAIMNAQIDRQSRLKLADDIINNNSSVEELVSQVDSLLVKYTNT